MRIERYETLLQMTTTVAGNLLPEAGISGIPLPIAGRRPCWEGPASRSATAGTEAPGYLDGLGLGYAGLCGLREELMKVFKMLKLDKILQFVKNEEDALKVLGHEGMVVRDVTELLVEAMEG